MEEAKHIGGLLPSLTNAMGSPALSTEGLDLMSLPDRLDDETLEKVKLISYLEHPGLPPCDSVHFSQCLRMMLAVLPRRHADDLAGELFVAAYEQALRSWSNGAIEYMTRRAIEQCKWFPTVAECIEMLKEWKRPFDEHDERKLFARQLANREISARDREYEEKKSAFFGRLERGEVTQEKISSLSVETKREATRLGLMKWDTDISDYVATNPCVPTQ